MADNDTAAPSGGTTDSGPLFTPSERAYFDTRGESPIEPEQKPESQPETPAEPQEAPPSEPSEKTVPHGALAEERGRRKDAEDRLRQVELDKVRMEERFRAWQQYTAPKPQAPQRPPTPEEDIFGSVNNLLQRQAYTEQQIQTYRQNEQAKAQIQQITNWANQSEAIFRQQNPDYDAALDHLRKSRVNELKAIYPYMNDFAANEQLKLDERQLLMQAAQMQMNPADLVMRHARQRGYQPKNAPDPNKQLDIIEAGQQASRTLSNVGGKAGGGVEMTLERLANLPQNEFVAYMNRNPAKFRRLMGG